MSNYVLVTTQYCSCPWI